MNKTFATTYCLKEMLIAVQQLFNSTTGFDSVVVRKEWVGEQDFPLGDRVLFILSPLNQRETDKVVGYENDNDKQYSVYFDLHIFANYQNDLFATDVFSLFSSWFNQYNSLTTKSIYTERILFEGKTEVDDLRNIRINAVLEVKL